RLLWVYPRAVVVGGERQSTRPGQRNLRSGECAPPPAQRQTDACRGPIHVHQDLGQQRAQQLLAITIGGGRRRPHPPQILAEALDNRALGGGQALRSTMLALFEFALGGGDCGELLLPVSFQATRDQAVLRVDCAVAALRATRFVASSFDLKTTPRE